MRAVLPLAIHAGFCAASALLARLAMSGEVDPLLLMLIPMWFLAIVVPVLVFGWPPPFGYMTESFGIVGARRLLLASVGAAAVGFAVFSLVAFDSALLGRWVDLVVLGFGAAALLLAHLGRPPRRRVLLKR